jgi:PAS domain-containing protein
MSQILKSFINKFSLYNLQIGLKINLLFYVLLMISFVVITIVGFNFLEKNIAKNTNEKLEQIVFHKKQLFEKEYNNFLTSTKNLFTEDLLSDIEELKNAYKDYPTNNEMDFYPDSLEKSKLLLEEYYQDEIIGKIEWNKPELDEIFPTRDQEIVLQKAYLVDNKWPVGEKDKLLSASTGSMYSTYHRNVHTNFRAFSRKYKINNVYLVDDKTGDIFYNFDKNISLGTNLFNGKFNKTELSRIFQEALSSTSPKGEFFYSDFTFFLPEYNRPVAYIARPLIMYNQRLAIAIIEVSPKYLENVINDPWLEVNKDLVEVNVIGTDNKFRMNEIEQITQPEVYFNRLKKYGLKNELLYKASLLGSANILGIEKELDKNNSDFILAKNYFGEEISALYLPLNIKGFKWTVIAYVKTDNNERLLVLARRKLFLVFVLLLIIATFSLQGVIKSMVFRLNKLGNAFISLSKGTKTEFLKTPWQDELGKTMLVFNSLNKRINDAGDFAIQLSEGNFEQEFAASSDDDSFAFAFNTLNKRLKENKAELEMRKKEDEKTGYLNQGIAKFNDLLRQSNNDIKTLSYIILENLIEYLSANQGGVFLVEGESDQNKHISLIASFAYDKRKYHTKNIEIGEGLIGNCYLEKKSIHLREIPDDYIEITSGLGKAKPRSLYIVPLMLDKEILGFIEIASLGDFEDYQINFIEKLSENIAATFSTVKLNTRTTQLLEESKKRTNEIAQQEEEMRQNMEEMLATQEELARLREDDEKKSLKLQSQIEDSNYMLQTIINSMDGEVILKDSHGVVVLANEEACLRYNLTIDSIKGKPDSVLLDKTILEEEYANDAEAQKEGKYVGYRTESVGGSLVEYIIEKRIFYLKKNDEKGIITIWNKADKGKV